MHPSVFLINAQSLLPKIDELKIVAAIESPDLLCITETWLSPAIPDVLLNIQNYDLCRTDRIGRRGGGTAIYLRETMKSAVLSVNENLNSIIQSTFIDLHQCKLAVLCVYIPPNKTADELCSIHNEIVNLVDDFLLKKDNYGLIILGDFNHFNVKHLCDELSLTDVISQPTRKKNTLDHFLITQDITSSYISDLVTYHAPLSSADHLMISVKPTMNLKAVNANRHHKVYDFRRSHMTFLSSLAHHVVWDDFLDPDDDVNVLWDKFHELVNSLLNECIPQRYVKMTDHDKEWMTPITKLLINQKWEAYRRQEWEKYNHLKVKVKEEILKAQQIMASKMKASNGGLWKLSKYLTGKELQDKWGSLIANTGGIKKTVDEIADEFAKITEITSQDPSESIQNDDWSIRISENEIVRYLKKLSPSKSPGIDGIPSKVYKHLAPYLATPLKIIFEASLRQRKFPEKWKIGIVVPVPKTNPPKIDKLRPITVLPAPAKILERIVLNNMWKKYEEAYGSSQHGFRPRSSTTTALIQLMNSALMFYDNASNFGSAVLSFDMAKAFDVIDHKLLIQKLRSFNMPNGHLLWLMSYLKSRQYCVKIRGQLSCLRRADRGIPQGSILGPILFCAFTGDFAPYSSTTTLIKYADDINLVLPLIDEREVSRHVTREIEHIRRWCCDNKLLLNEGKTKIIVNTRHRLMHADSFDGSICDNMKVLGVKIDCDLTWTSHIEDITRKANQRFYLLRKLKKYLPLTELHLLYVSLVRPLLEYASPVFVGLNAKLNNKLQRIDNRAHRIIFQNSPRQCHCISNTIQERRITTSKKLFTMIERTDKHILRDLIPCRLPKTNLYRNIFARTHKYKTSFIPYITEHLNNDFLCTD